MKRIFFTLISFFLINFNIFSANSKIDSYDYSNLVISIKESASPQVLDNCIIFTQENVYRNAGIAFDFEDFKIIHPFQIRKTEDIDGNITNSVMFYILEKPENIDKISYKVILDGLWTTDPTNKNYFYDSQTGIRLSTLNIPRSEKNYTEYTKDNSVRFVYNGEPGLTIRLAGNFTNWDSWIYTLNETRPGFYELSLNLPKGTYYYNYFSGFEKFYDKTNPERVYTQDGKVVSVLKVEN